MSTPNKNSKPETKSNAQTEIEYRNKSLGIVTKESLAAIARSNSPPHLFQQDGFLVRVRQADGDVFPERLTIDTLRYHLGRCADFVLIFSKRQNNGKGKIIKLPPIDFVRDLLAAPSWDEAVFPRLKGVVKSPYFTATGELVIEPGYCRTSQLWYESGDLVVSPVPKTPSSEDINEAKRWIVTELLGDFPFQQDTDRANAISFLLTPFVREMIDGPVPMALIEAPAAGTGKGLLANVLAIPSTGSLLETIPQRESDEEWRKAITAKLIEIPSHILLDNLTGTLRSAALEAALTSERWTDRILGESRMVRLRPRSIFMATANNLRLEGDLHRRVVWFRLDAKMERPEERKPSEFKHPNLIKWTKEYRTKLVWACLVLVQNWIAKGRYRSADVMGSYENWACILGGILSDSGLTGFLANIQDRRRDGDEDLEQLKRFVYEWWKSYGFDTVIVADLYKIVMEEELLPYVVAAETVIGQKQRLGRYLGKHEDSTVGQYQIRRLKGLHRNGVRKYQLVDLKAEKEAGSANGKGVSSQPTEKHFKGLIDDLPVNESEFAETMSQDRAYDEEQCDDEEYDNDDGDEFDPDDLDA